MTLLDPDPAFVPSHALAAFQVALTVRGWWLLAHSTLVGWLGLMA